MNNEVNWGLKPRDFQILRLLVAEKGRKQIADELHISTSLLRLELGRIYRQLGVHGNVGAAVWATKHLPNPEAK